MSDNLSEITRITLALYRIQRAVDVYNEGHHEVSWYWLFMWKEVGGSLN